MRLLAIALLSALLGSGCATTPPPVADARFFHDALFGPSSERINAADVFALSPEMKVLSGLAGNTATPQELMHGLLLAPADLLWFGGIGTYVKASGETHAQVGDRANDGLRIIADQADITQLLIGQSVIQRQSWPSIRGLCRATAELEWFSRGKRNNSRHVAGLGSGPINRLEVGLSA